MCAAAVVLWATNAFAQKPTSFAGTWVREAPAGGGGGGGGGRQGGGGGGGAFNCGMECTIVQDAKTLTIKRASMKEGAPAPADIVITLGGDSKIMMGGRGGGTEVTVNSKWDGAKLVLSMTRDMQGTPVTSTQTISMEGGKLVIESTGPGRGGEVQTTKATYTKKM
jgi:hypothetical protein